MPRTMQTLTLILERQSTSDQGTFGRLHGTGNTALWVAELPWRDNAKGRSCIPAGAYRVEHLSRSASGKYHDVYHVTEVEGRTGILIHSGNFAGDRMQGWRTHSWGCLLPGLRAGELNNGYGRDQQAVLASRAALSRLHETTMRRGFYLEILEAGQ